MFYNGGIMNIDKLVAKHTPFYDLEDMVMNKNTIPTINCVTAKKRSDREELKQIADQYDRIMNVRNDKRRAKRF